MAKKLKIDQFSNFDYQEQKQLPHETTKHALITSVRV